MFAPVYIFWSLIGLFALLALVLMETESFGFLTFVTVCAVAVFGWKAIAAAMSWKLLIQIVGAYIGVGGIWSVFKWWRYTLQVLSDYNRHRITSRIAQCRLTPSENKGKIIAWIIYWPLSMFWSITYDVWNLIWRTIRSTYEITWGLLRGTYEKISECALSKIYQAEEQK